ncbi:MAG: thioredoxin family protein [Thermoplasmata archaeon]|nr:thioredoxin family protein [Thermoplasmata archaeon]
MELLGPESFEGQRLLRPGTWVVNFSADWCPFCEQFLPTFASLEGTGEFQVAIGDLTDLESPLWDRFDLAVTPTLIAFREGMVVFRADGRRGIGLGQDAVRAARAALAPGSGRPSSSPGPRP